VVNPAKVGDADVPNSWSKSVILSATVLLISVPPIAIVLALTSNLPNEPVEVDEPLINSKLPVLKFVILLEKLPLSDFKLVTRVENEELAASNVDVLDEKLPESVFKFVTLVAKLDDAS